MIRTSLKLTSLALSIVVMAAHPAQAADNTNAQARPGTPVKSEPTTVEKSTKAIPFHGKLAAKSENTITVGTRVFEVTQATKITKDGKPATLADGEFGKEVAGQYWQRDGKLVAKSIRLGPKPKKVDQQTAAEAEAPAATKAK
jgi:hypothetical protein